MNQIVVMVQFNLHRFHTEFGVMLISLEKVGPNNSRN